jgi:hypothetical protein
MYLYDFSPRRLRQQEFRRRVFRAQEEKDIPNAIRDADFEEHRGDAAPGTGILLAVISPFVIYGLFRLFT